MKPSRTRTGLLSALDGVAGLSQVPGGDRARPRRVPSRPLDQGSDGCSPKLGRLARPLVSAYGIGPW